MNTALIDYDERERRLNGIVSGAHCLRDTPLLKILKADVEHRSAIVTALNAFLLTCLKAAWPERAFSPEPDMLAAYQADILALPNVTPNGMILPKAENIDAFNRFQAAAAAGFAALGLHYIARVQFPVNIRLQSGAHNEARDRRPRASTKLHSDIWAGDPASGTLVFLCLLGSPVASGIEFFKAERFPLDLVRPLEDFNEGAHLMAQAEYVRSFDDSGWFLVDPYLLHRTIPSGAGARISLDFRFIPTLPAASDRDEDDSRKPFFIAFDQWQRLGTSLRIHTTERMADWNKASAAATPYTMGGYPTKISLESL